MQLVSLGHQYLLIVKAILNVLQSIINTLFFFQFYQVFSSCRKMWEDFGKEILKVSCQFVCDTVGCL